MHVELDKSKGKALYIQLYEYISNEICTGRILKGSRLPARRVLAHELGISQNTVDSAYKMLADTGYVNAIPRRGFIVTFTSSEYNSNTPWEKGAGEQIVFSPNGIDITRINRSAYAKILRDIAYNDGTDIFSYVEKGGEFELRSAISKYLYSFRGVKCSPDCIIIGAGAEYLLCSLAALFAARSPIICENPCDTHFYRTLLSYNLPVSSLPLNTDTFDFDALNSIDGNVLLIDPDLRFPRKAALSINERAALLDWAAKSDKRYIIENCCDSELTSDTASSLYGMDNRNVIYLGSFARSFCPGIKTSYMVLPPELLTLWKNAHTYYYALSSKSEQFALAEFINKGYFTRHYKNMRRLYKDKYKLLANLLSEYSNGILSCNTDHASTYITVKSHGLSTNKIKQLARRNGVKLLSFKSYLCTAETQLDNDRLVLGIGDLSREDIKLGARIICDCLN